MAVMVAAAAAAPRLAAENPRAREGEAAVTVTAAGLVARTTARTAWQATATMAAAADAWQMESAAAGQAMMMVGAARLVPKAPLGVSALHAAVRLATTMPTAVSQMANETRPTGAMEETKAPATRARRGAAGCIRSCRAFQARAFANLLVDLSTRRARARVRGSRARSRPAAPHAACSLACLTRLAGQARGLIWRLPRGRTAQLGSSSRQASSMRPARAWQYRRRRQHRQPRRGRAPSTEATSACWQACGILRRRVSARLWRCLAPYPKA